MKRFFVSTVVQLLSTLTCWLPQQRSWKINKHNIKSPSNLSRLCQDNSVLLLFFPFGTLGSILTQIITQSLRTLNKTSCCSENRNQISSNWRQSALRRNLNKYLIILQSQRTEFEKTMAQRLNLANFSFWTRTFDEIMFQDDNNRGRNKSFTSEIRLKAGVEMGRSLVFPTVLISVQHLHLWISSSVCHSGTSCDKRHSEGHEV